MVNDHTRSAENWKCVWYFLHPIDGSSACAKRRSFTVFRMDRVGSLPRDCGVYYCCFQCCSFTLFRMDRVGACRADCGVYYCCRLNAICPSICQGVLGGHKFKSLGKLSKSWTDWHQIWYTSADSSGYGHRLNTIRPSISQGAFWVF